MLGSTQGLFSAIEIGNKMWLTDFQTYSDHKWSFLKFGNQWSIPCNTKATSKLADMEKVNKAEPGNYKSTKLQLKHETN